MPRRGRPSIVKQVLDRLQSMIRFGESKHAAKRMAKQEALMRGERWNPARVDGIFSIKTYKTYKDECLRFANWVRSQKGVKDIDDARQYVGEYLREAIAKGQSAWTIKTKAAALAKLYGCSSKDFGVELPTRRREDIVRSRLPRAHDSDFSPERNKDAVDLARATGLRRRELSALRPEDVYRGADGRVYVHVRRGKGGRSREVPVREEFQERVWQMREERVAAGKTKMLDRVPWRMDVHAYRREYASARYQELERTLPPSGEIYRRRDGRVFDRGWLRIISQNLGHNREDVVARHYLD